MVRNKKLLDAARGQPCQISIPSVCNNDPATTVACHANWYEYGKGMGIKAHDCYAAWGCSACHAALDVGSNLSYAERKEYWRRGFEKTILALFTAGFINVK
jgi:hypothetical protein